jgi:hypothetical protein
MTAPSSFNISEIGNAIPALGFGTSPMMASKPGSITGT